jgi:hypothetical protein
MKLNAILAALRMTCSRFTTMKRIQKYLRHQLKLVSY